MNKAFSSLILALAMIAICLIGAVVIASTLPVGGTWP